MRRRTRFTFPERGYMDKRSYQTDVTAILVTRMYFIQDLCSMNI